MTSAGQGRSVVGVVYTGKGDSGDDEDDADVHGRGNR